MARKKASSPEDAPGTFEERLAAKFELKLASQPLTSDIEEYISTQCAMLDYAIGRPGIPVGRVTVFYGKEGAGKALALNTPIPTVKGWRLMGDLAVGDPVFGEDGRPHRIVATRLYSNRPCYRVLFSDGSEIVADAEHEWLVDGVLRNTRELSVLPRRHKGTATLLHKIPLAAPLQYPNRPLPIPPYTLGAWLGDGATLGATITCGDTEILVGIEGDGFSLSAPRPSTAGKVAPTYGMSGLTVLLRAEGVLGNKHIPRVYLEAAQADRLALLQGLMDTDGYASKNGVAEFTVTNMSLAWDVRFLARTLGYRVHWRQKTAKYNGKEFQAYTVTIGGGHLPPFRLPRKATRMQGHRRCQQHRIVRIESTEAQTTKCIQVDNPSGLFLAGPACVPTHNSSVAYHVLAETQRRGGLAILIDAEHRYSRDRGERLGLIPARLVMPTPTTLEDCFMVIEEIIKWVREEDPARLVCIVIDSLSALDAKKNLDLAVGEQAQLGLAARTISREMQRLGPMLAEHKVALIIVNQLRQHLDIMGDPRSRERRKAMKRHTMTGEGALVFWGSLLVYFTSTGVIKDDDAQTGITVRAEIRKSSIAPEGKQSLFDIDAIDGVDKEGSQLDLLETLKIVTKAGPWYSLDGIKFQRKQFPTVLAERPELLQKIQEAPLLWRPDPNEKAEETADA